MNTLIDTPMAARHSDGYIEITMTSGNHHRIPVSASDRLSNASHAELDDIELSPFGLHWPKLDEDLSVRGIIAEASEH